jgi:hypothetical protein
VRTDRATARGKEARRLVVCRRPLDGEDGRLEELLGGILLVDELLVEIGLEERLLEKGEGDLEVRLGEARVEDEVLVLRGNRTVSSPGARSATARTQSPPSIFRAAYMPMAAVKLGLARRKR